MKKKLVAFAVTAAMIITSAVPVFAATGGWEQPTEDTPVQSGNQYVVDKNLPGGAVTKEVAGPINGGSFETVIDLNRSVGHIQINLSLSGSEGAKREVGVKASEFSTGVWNMANGAEDQQVNGVSGIITLKWTVNTDKVIVDVYENGNKTKPVGTFTYTLEKGLTTIDSMKAFAADGKVDTEKIVIYTVAPDKIQSIKVGVVNDKYDSSKPVSETNQPYTEVTQPILAQDLVVYELTLDNGVVITGTDLEEYVGATWYAGTTELGDKLTQTVTDAAKGSRVTAVVKAVEGSGVFGTITWGANSDPLARFTRYEGANRYETAMSIAAGTLAQGQTFKGVVVASGADYADALSAVALGSKNGYPVLLVNEHYEDAVVDFINENGTFKGTTIYIVGGTGVVSQDFEDALYKYTNVTRLAGADRYATNLEVLKALNLTPSANNVILVASGTAYADVLSAAATGEPVLLVGNTLTKAQKDYLKGLHPGNDDDRYYIIGGTGVVSKNVAATLRSKDYVLNTAVNEGVKRVAGANRYATNKEVYDLFKTLTKTNGDKYFVKDKVYVATGDDFADGLVAAANAAAQGMPLALVNENNASVANKIIKAQSITDGNVFIVGGTGAVSNELVQKIVVG